jgi:predicted RNA-binding protein YlxR (DUF448 family)
VRVVRTPSDGVQVDERGKLSGRGAYLCREASCWEETLATGGKHLEFALKTDLTDDEKETLRKYASSLYNREGQRPGAREQTG